MEYHCVPVFNPSLHHRHTKKKNKKNMPPSPLRLQITLCAENKRGEKTTEINYEEKLCQSHR